MNGNMCPLERAVTMNRESPPITDDGTTIPLYHVAVKVQRKTGADGPAHRLAVPSYILQARDQLPLSNGTIESEAETGYEHKAALLI